MREKLIQPNDFVRQWSDTEAAVMAAVAHVGRSGWYVLGQHVREFEAALASYWGLEHAVGVASGLDAIEIGLRVLGCGPGDRVLTTPISAFATTLAILKVGGVPVFADCDSTGLIDMADCRCILSQDRQIRYFIPVHLYGHALHLDELSALRAEFGLKVIEDCAQSIGALSSGRKAGTAGDIAATSFYPTKNLGALGDGGALLTNSVEYAGGARMLRDYGQSSKYRHEAIGYNSRLDELHAAILGHAFLPRLAEWTERRRAVASMYRGGLSNNRIQIPPPPPGSDSCYHLFPVTVDPDRKQDFLAYLRENGVVAGEHYPIAIPDQPAMHDIHWTGEVPRARRFCAAEVSLPIHPYLTDEEAATVIDACNRWKS